MVGLSGSWCGRATEGVTKVTASRMLAGIIKAVFLILPVFAIASTVFVIIERIVAS